jgi:homoserine O-acetyltransferase
VEAALADPASLRRGLGPVLPVRCPKAMLELKALEQKFPLEFDLNASTEAEWLAAGLDAATRARVLDERDRAPFASVADFEKRTAKTLQALGLEVVTPEGPPDETIPAATRSSLLLPADAPELNRTAPDVFRVRLDTTAGVIVIEVHRAWAPHGADRFYNLVANGYYDGSRFYRVIKDKWAQFGISATPEIASLWRTRAIPDDPRVESNTRGTVAFAFAVPNGRTTQVFINLRDNSPTHDKEPFVPFGRVVEGMAAADALYSDYGETSGGGIRAGRQDPLFQGGSAYLEKNFPLLSIITKATIEPHR